MNKLIKTSVGLISICALTVLLLNVLPTDEVAAQPGQGKAIKQFVYIRGQDAGPTVSQFIYTVPVGCALEITDIHIDAANTSTIGHHVANIFIAPVQSPPPGTATYAAQFDVFAPETVTENLSTGVQADAGDMLGISTALGSGSLDYAFGGTLSCEQA